MNGPKVEKQISVFALLEYKWAWQACLILQAILGLTRNNIWW